MDRLAYAVAGRAGNGGNYRQFLSRQTIQQARLAYVGLTREHHLQPGAQQTTLAAFGQRRFDCCRELRMAPLGVGAIHGIDFFLGKIQRSLDQGAQFDQLAH